MVGQYTPMRPLAAIAPKHDLCRPNLEWTCSLVQLASIYWIIWIGTVLLVVSLATKFVLYRVYKAACHQDCSQLIRMHLYASLQPVLVLSCNMTICCILVLHACSLFALSMFVCAQLSCCYFYACAFSCADKLLL